MRAIVYFNVRRKDFSVKLPGEPMRHMRYLTLHNVTFRVRKAGQAKVRETGVKNVHAFVVGELDESGQCWRTSRGMGMSGTVRYNPKRDDHFMSEEGPIFSARCVELGMGRGVPTITYMKETPNV